VSRLPVRVNDSQHAEEHYAVRNSAADPFTWYVVFSAVSPHRVQNAGDASRNRNDGRATTTSPANAVAHSRVGAWFVDSASASRRGLFGRVTSAQVVRLR